MAASFFSIPMSFDDFTCSRMPVPSGYFGASSTTLMRRLGHLLCRTICIALSPNMKATLKQPAHGASHTIVRFLHFTRRDQPALVGGLDWPTKAFAGSLGCAGFNCFLAGLILFMFFAIGFRFKILPAEK